MPILQFSLQRFAFILLVLFADINPARAQTTFQRTYGGTGNDVGYSVQQTSDGGYIIAGYTSSFGAGYDNVYLIKTNSLGDTLWTRTYGGTDSDHQGSSVWQTFDGGYIIAGSTDPVGAVPGLYLVRTNSIGDTIWTKTNHVTHIWVHCSVQQTADSGYIIAGTTNAPPGGMYLVKTNSSGDTLWTRTYGSNGSVGHSVQQTSDGGYIIAGWALSDIYLVKTNSSGDTLWTRTIGDTSNFYYGLSVQQTSDGGYIIAGSTVPNPRLGPTDLYIVKTNSSGDTLWTRTYGDATGQFGQSVQQTSDGGYIIAGITGEQIGGGDVYLVKTNSSGDTLWTKTFLGDPYDAYGYSVQQTSDGGYIIAGVIGFSHNGSNDVYLIKTLGDGTVSVKDDRSVMPTAFALLQNFPNPFNPSTKINYSVPQSSNVVIKVFGVLGNDIETLVNEEKPAGTYEVTWYAENLPSGVYFYQIRAGEFIQTKKMLLLK